MIDRQAEIRAMVAGRFCKEPTLCCPDPKKCRYRHTYADAGKRFKISRQRAWTIANTLSKDDRDKLR